MPRRDDRYRTNSLNQLQESRQSNIENYRRRVTRRENQRNNGDDYVEIDMSGRPYGNSQIYLQDENPYSIFRNCRIDNEPVEVRYSDNSNLTPRSVRNEGITASTIDESYQSRLSELQRHFQRDIFGYFQNDNPYTNHQKKRQVYKYIKPYNYTPEEFNFNKTHHNENLYLGIELEIDKGGKSDDNAKYIQEHLGDKNCYIMHDGSLDDGLEIVTHPCTINYHKELPYQDLFTELTERGYRSHQTDTCGYHIHINRDFFSNNPTIQDLCITKILYLMEKYWGEVKRIARRDSNHYARRFNMKESESMFELLIKAKGAYSSKYNMVNLQHCNTIEFRIFRGTLKYETFIATMEFIHNLAYICKYTELENIQDVKFQDILDIRPTEYLIDYLNSRR